MINIFCENLGENQAVFPFDNIRNSSFLAY